MAIETSALECPMNVPRSEQFPERAKVEVEIFFVDSKMFSELCHLLAELKERHSQPFDLVIGQPRHRPASLPRYGGSPAAREAGGSARPG